MQTELQRETERAVVFEIGVERISDSRKRFVMSSSGFLLVLLLFLVGTGESAPIVLPCFDKGGGMFSWLFLSQRPRIAIWVLNVCMERERERGEMEGGMRRYL